MAETEAAAKRPTSGTIAGQVGSVAAPGGTSFPLTLHFQNMPANLPHVVALGGERGGAARAVWSVEAGPKREQRLMIAAPAGSQVNLQLFIITDTHLTVAVAQSTHYLDVSLYVRAPRPWISGSVLLPPGAIVTPQSSLDRTNVVGAGSWFLSFDEP